MVYFLLDEVAKSTLQANISIIVLATQGWSLRVRWICVPENDARIQRNGLGRSVRFSFLVVSCWKILIRHFLGRLLSMFTIPPCFYIASSKLDAGLAEADSAEGPARAIEQSHSYYGWPCFMTCVSLVRSFRFRKQCLPIMLRRFCLILDFPMGEENKKKKMMTELASKSCDA